MEANRHAPADDDELVDEASADSFPASDSPGYRSSSLSGPPGDLEPVAPGTPAGLSYRTDFISTDEEQRLLEHIEGPHAARSAEPIPDWLLWLRDRCAQIVQLEAEDLAEALVTRHPPGTAVDWHSDHPQRGDVMVAVSLGAPCHIRFRRMVDGIAQSHSMDVDPRSAYVLAGAARSGWENSIPAVTGLRHSITFRSEARPSRS